jgi:flagellar biosynthetic protein FliR
MDLLGGKMLGFVLVMTRIGAFFATAPVFSWQSIPVKVKLVTALLLSVFFASNTSYLIKGEDTLVLEAAILMVMEIIYGLAMGLTATFLFTSIKIGARIVERQMGLAMASVMDPLSGESGQTLGVMIEMIFMLLFLSANGHHIFIMTMSKSYDAFPIGTIPQIGTLTEGLINTSVTMLILGLKISAPMLAASFLLMVILGVMARIAPEMNILFLSLPMRVGMGLFMVGIFFPFINNFVQDFAGWMDKLMPL